MPIVGLHHLDLAVSDLSRSLAFYLDLLRPLGAEEAFRYPTYRGSEEVVYLRLGQQYLGLRPADGGEHRYYEVGIEHLAVFVDRREEVDQTYARSLELGARVHFPPQEDRDEPGYWALFVFDPDGFRVEVAHWPRDPGAGTDTACA
jgi:catechol 2,3-dioxygenase-like lactoylglutathione lyase family enzyme